MEKRYAPVIIPTLCRSEHFKQCLDSLAENPEAKYTEVFIGLDYPLKETHKKGHHEIEEYLDNSDIKYKFKALHVFKRDKNYGPTNNLNLLIDEIIKRFDRYILSEDDNVFSPNFLEYINKGLMESEKDDSIFAVCGYNNPSEIPHKNNNFYRNNVTFYPWGYGILLNQTIQLNAILTRKFLLKKLLNPYWIIKMAHHSYITLLFAILRLLKSDLTTDNVYSLYMWLMNKDILVPVVSKVRNIGFDGTGVHCGIDYAMTNQEIDSEYSFDYIGTGKEYYDEINAAQLKGLREYMSGKDMVITISKWIMIRIKRLFH